MKSILVAFILLGLGCNHERVYDKPDSSGLQPFDYHCPNEITTIQSAFKCLKSDQGISLNTPSSVDECIETTVDVGPLGKSHTILVFKCGRYGVTRSGAIYLVEPYLG